MLVKRGFAHVDHLGQICHFHLLGVVIAYPGDGLHDTLHARIGKAEFSGVNADGASQDAYHNLINYKRSKQFGIAGAVQTLHQSRYRVHQAVIHVGDVACAALTHRRKALGIYLQGQLGNPLRVEFKPDPEERFGGAGICSLH
ncbi:hypothetical protein D3C76_1452680 [compost metagenome]